MRSFNAATIDPTEPLYDGEARMAGALAVLTASSNSPTANVPTVQAKVPTVTTNVTRHARPFHMRSGQQVARRNLRPTPRMGATRFTRVRNTFESSASPRPVVQRETRISSAMLMASSRRNARTPVANYAHELDRVRSRANAQATINALMHRKFNNLADLSDGVANNNHLFRHARNFNRDKNTRLDPAVAALMLFG